MRTTGSNLHRQQLTYPGGDQLSEISGFTFAGKGFSKLQQTINNSWPNNASRYRRLYALGIDAYRLTPYLGELGNNRFAAYHGVTGNLSLGARGHINRSLRCAKFSRGLPVLLEPTVTSETREETTSLPAETIPRGYTNPR